MTVLSDHKLTWIYSDYIAHLDGVTKIDGGWINKNYIQLGYQLADSVSGMAYAFFGTCIILFVMNLIPGLSLRAPEEDEIMGIDDAEIGEFAVSFIVPGSAKETFSDILSSSMITLRSPVTLSTAWKARRPALSALLRPWARSLTPRLRSSLI